MTDIEKILSEREKTHGSFAHHAKTEIGLVNVCVANQKNKFTDVQQTALHMILHKIARIVAGNPNHQDHWDDIAGYAILASKELQHDNSM